MRLRFGIPLTLAIWWVVASVGNVAAFNFWFLASACIAIAVVWDIRMLQLRPIYPTLFPLHPLGAFIAVGMLWPVMLPWYLKLRWKIGSGALQPGERHGTLAWVVVAVALGIGGAVMALVSRSATGPLMTGLQRTIPAVQQEYNGPFTVHVQNGAYLTVFLLADTMGTGGDELRKAHALRIALAAWSAYPDSDAIANVHVTYRTVTRTGFMTMTRDVVSYRWFPSELRAVRAQLPSSQ